MHTPDRGPNSAWWNAFPLGFGGTYRYFTGSLAYVLHRVSGIALLVFLVFHIISVTKANASPEAYDLMIRRMQEPDFKFGEIALFAALLFHGLNGVRILIVDFVVQRTAVHKRLFWGFAVITAVLLVVGTIPLALHHNVQPIMGDDRLPGAAVPGGK